MEAGTSAPHEQAGYPGTTVVAAALATLFFPLFSLIAALLLVSGQTTPYKRAQVRMWAWVSAGWLVLQFVVVVALFAAASHSTDGGPTIVNITSVTTTSP